MFKAVMNISIRIQFNQPTLGMNSSIIHSFGHYFGFPSDSPNHSPHETISDRAETHFCSPNLLKELNLLPSKCQRDVLEVLLKIFTSLYEAGKNITKCGPTSDERAEA